MYKEIKLSPPDMNGYELQNAIDSINLCVCSKYDKYIRMFEQKVCSFLGTSLGMAVTSGPAAMQLALEALGVGRGDFVFYSDLSLPENCYPALYKGAIPVFIDSKSEGWGMSELALEEAIFTLKKEGKLPKAVVVADAYGQSADYEKILPVCESFGIPLVEDASQALGASYHGKLCGNYGSAAILSFSKDNLVTALGGGMILFGDKELVSNNSNAIRTCFAISDVCAAIGLGQLEYLSDKIERKRKIYNIYKESFKSVPVDMMPLLKNSEPNYWLSVLTIRKDSSVTPAEVFDALKQIGAESCPVMEPLHLNKTLQGSYLFASNRNRVSESVFGRGICLPSGSDLKAYEQQNIIEVVSRVFRLHGEV